MNFNDQGLDLIKSFEGCRLTAYQDQKGIWTIGWGHTGVDVTPSLVWTQEQADDQLLKDLSSTITQVKSAVKASISDNQFSALVCFTYNCGIGNFSKSTLLNCVNKGYLQDAAEEFMKWNHVNGIVNAGLTRRRQAERSLFLTL